MSLLIDIVFNMLSYLPRIFNWWLFKPERTTRQLDIDISAQEGSIEIWCDRSHARFAIIIQFRNNNPFPIEIDRAEASASLHTARFKAINIFGIKIKKGETQLLRLEGRIDDENLKYVNRSPEGENLRMEFNAVIMNKYHTIRDFRKYFDRLMCKLINKSSEHVAIEP